jgi:hypothetical protein
MLTLRENPPATWPSDLKLANVTDDWTVAYCNTRQENYLAMDLASKDNC